MKKILFSLVALCLFAVSFAQNEKLSKKEKAALDSMRENDEFMKMMDKGKDKTAFEISAGIGNGSFSMHNLANNSTGLNNQVVFTPSLTYRDKSGFSIGVTGFLTHDSATNTMELYQTGISPAYDYYGKDVTAGISYTHFIADTKKYNGKSIYQDEVYGYLKAAKGSIQPGVTMGFARGNSKEINAVLFTPPVGQPRIVKDSTINKSSYFSLTGLIQHAFSFENLFDKEDGLEFTPALMLNAGSDKISFTHENLAYNKIPAFRKRKKGSDSQGFQVQSAGLSLDFVYSVGKFFFQPSAYFDYFLPKTTSNRFTTIYSIIAGVSF